MEKNNNSVSLADEDGVKRILAETMLGLWSTVNNLSRLTPSKRDRYRVSIFGSARTDPTHWVYQEVRRMSRELAGMGCDIMTGGGPGLMQAANEGAQEAAAAGLIQNIGIRVDLPFEQEVNAFVNEAFEHRTFFTRLHQFVLTSDAFVVAPGGIGTVLETMMVWQLLQVNHLRDTPLILVGRMWPGLIEWVRQAMLTETPPLASAADLTIPRCVATGNDAIAILRGQHARWLAGQAR
jgi:hypothetical protein